MLVVLRVGRIRSYSCIAKVMRGCRVGRIQIARTIYLSNKDVSFSARTYYQALSGVGQCNDPVLAVEYASCRLLKAGVTIILPLPLSFYFSLSFSESAPECLRQDRSNLHFPR